MTSVVLTHNFFDQRLSDVILVLCLENNYIKWRVEQIFGQFQKRLISSVVISIDCMLVEFKKFPGEIVGGHMAMRKMAWLTYNLQKF